MEFSIIKHIRFKMIKAVNFALVLLSFVVFAPSAYSANKLLDIKYHAVVDHQLEVEFIFENDITVPLVDASATPAQLKISFADSVSSVNKSKFNIEKVGVIDLSLNQSETTLNAIISLDRIRPYQARVIGNRYRLTINDSIKQESSNSTSSYINNIKNIDFKRSQTGGSELIVKLNNSSIAFNVEQVGAKLELKFYNTEIGEDLLYIVDVNDFDTPIKSFETFREDLTSRILVDVAGTYKYTYNQDGNQIRLLVDEEEPEVIEKKEKVYTGKKFTLNFQNISVRAVLQIIADQNNFNLVVSDTVEGDITIRLDSVPWDQALDLILRQRGLGMRLEGNVMMVAPAEEIAIRESNELKNKKEVEELAPLYSEYIQINYAKAEDLANLFKSDDSSLLSKRGTVAVDTRTNTLLVKDTADTIENVARLVKILDIPIKQVLIEARVVTVRDNIAEDLGVRWGFTNRDGDSGTTGRLDGLSNVSNGVVPPIGDRLNVNLPAPSDVSPTSIAFRVADFADGTLLDLELSALEKEDKAEIVASPRLLTSNQTSGYISQGVEIPYVQAASSGATTVTFKPAVLSLKVTPQITPDNRIILDLEITQDSRGENVQTPTGTAVSIDTQRIGTQALVKNGETIVLGGIFQQQVIDNVNKVPLLGDIPYLGYFFRNSQKKNERRELLIFVTPKIVTEEL
ncbi:type IV pilus secretin PilQ [Shewanella sp. OPT22]|nr:type IV pilus secretin PilQ [Shewanella sp. OPT22]